MLKPPIRKALLLICTVSALLVSQRCAGPRITRELHEVENAKFVNAKHQYVKVHMKDGNLYVLHDWKVDDPGRAIRGYGNYLDVNRKLIEGRGAYEDNKKRSHVGLPFSVLYEDIVLVETNDRGTNPGVAAMVVAGIATASFGVLCIANPKACFGSCPTFYVDQGDSLRLVGEGFSSSISKTTEAVDVDIIDAPITPGSKDFFLTVRNEAWETHMIKRVNLLVAPKSPGHRILREQGGGYLEVSNFRQANRAEHEGVSIRPRINGVDDKEWYSLADSTDLLAKEEIELDFANPGGEIGLAMVKRQSLMTTFLFYHSLSLLGKAAGYYYGRMEAGDDRIVKATSKLYELLGGIEVAYRDDRGRWQKLAEINEQGPIAEEYSLVRLPSVQSPKVSLRLRMTKGLWRINALNLVSIVKPVQPVSLNPVSASRNERVDSSALARLNTRSDYLVTYPGDDYRLHFILPSEEPMECFIETEGYYIEWMRDEWLPGQNLPAARWMFLAPRRYLRSMAPDFKQHEPEMENVFWDSKYTKK